MADEEETISEDGGEAIEDTGAGETAPEAEAGELVPEAPAGKPRNDVFTLILVLTFVAFLAGTFIAGNELYDFYDVNFFVLGKK